MIMNNTKNLILALLTAIIPVVAMPYDFKEGGLCFNFNDDGKSVTLTYERLIMFAHDAPPPSEKGLIGDVVIPSKVQHDGKTYKVTAIDRETFMANSELKSVIIPNSVKTIGRGAFAQCFSLKNVVLPTDLTEISDYMFSESNLTEITIPAKVKRIGEHAFNSSSLKSIAIPNSVTEIGKSAFSACRWMESATLGNSVKTIGEAAFSICPSLRSINLPASLCEIGEHAFYEGGMEAITIPAATTKIGSGAFIHCNNLATLQVDKSNKVYDSRNNCNAVIETATGTLVAGCNISVIPEGVTKIGSEAFYGHKGIYSLNLPSTVTEIGDKAFFYCDNLKEVNLPNSVTAIGERAFCGCDSLETVVIPNSVKRIGYSAFLHNKKLRSVTLGSAVTQIDAWAFKGLNNLKSFTTKIADAGTVKMGKDVFDEIDKQACTLYVPRGSAASYKAAPQWQDFKNIVEQ